MKTNIVLFMFLLIIQGQAKATNTETLTVYKNSIEDISKISRGIGTFASVGNGAACTHTTIQSAIDSLADEVRVVHDQVYQEDIVINVRDVLIQGNFSTCENANANSSTSDTDSIIEGVAGIGAVVSIKNILRTGETTNGTPPKITFWNIEIRNGTAGFVTGGGIHADSTTIVDINIWDSYIHNNTGLTGGGISINGSSTVRISSSQISSNSAQYGGGIFCNNGNSDITTFGSSINSNLAFKSPGIENGKGGGAFISNDCVLSVYDYASGGGFNLNQAQGEGGGIYAQSGSDIYFTRLNDCTIGSNCTPTAVNLIGNESDSDHSGDENGGGALITGAGTRLIIHDANIVGNKSGGHGGAISIEDGAELFTQVSKNCWNPGNCVLFSNNKAGEQAFGAGGAIFNSSSTANIERATFTGNRADFGSVIYGSGLNSTTNITGSIFHHNGDGGGNSGANGFSDNYVIRVVSDAVLHLLSSTVADNNATLGVLGISTSVTATSTILSSIIFDSSSGNVFASGSTGYITDCILAHETTSFINVGNSSTTVDPIFLDPANADYHIARFSPAIDYCDNFMSASNEQDIDREDRGYDDPSLFNLNGPYDVGADETYASDIIFKHGFED